MGFLQHHEGEVKEEGMKEGIEKGIKKVAIKMLKSNFNDSDIRRFTNLSKKELQALKKELELV